MASQRLITGYFSSPGPSTQAQLSTPRPAAKAQINPSRPSAKTQASTPGPSSKAQVNSSAPSAKGQISSPGPSAQSRVSSPSAKPQVSTPRPSEKAQVGTPRPSAQAQINSSGPSTKPQASSPSAKPQVGTPRPSDAQINTPGPSSKAQASTESIAPPSSPTLKRKRDPDEQLPSPPAAPRPFERASSFISISSGDDDHHNNGANQGPTSLSGRDAPATEPNLCKEQQDLIDLIMSGRNVFFTGSAGCGKSTVLKAAVKKLEDSGRTVYVTAPTGRAAVQVGGMTTWSYMGWYPDLLKKGIAEVKNFSFKKNTKRRLRKTDVLIIDEISMVDSDHLQRINECMKAVIWSSLNHGSHERPPPFGGVQVIVTGDFCQLPPVKPFQHCYYCGAGENNMFRTEEEEECNKRVVEYNCINNHGPFYEKDKWAFRSSAWEEANFAHVNLEEIHRQNDQSFIKLLQKCRLGIPFSQQEVTTLTDHECEVDNAARLLCTKQEVDPINRKKFNAIPKKYKERSYRVYDTFLWNGKIHWERSKYEQRERDGTLSAFKEQQFDGIVKLKETMLVMLQVNLDIKRGLVNGSQGVICGWEPMDIDNLPGLQGEQSDNREAEVEEFLVQHMSEHQDPAMHYWPRVRFSNGITRTIYPWCITNTVGDTQPYSRLFRTQIPLVPGWAVTVHRSQGMTLDRVIVDLTRSFEEGQVYVALSRATSLNGLKVEGSTAGLRVGEGGNKDVRDFLIAKFGNRLFRNHAGSTVGPSNSIEGAAS